MRLGASNLSLGHAILQGKLGHTVFIPGSSMLNSKWTLFPKARGGADIGRTSSSLCHTGTSISDRAKAQRMLTLDLSRRKLRGGTED